MNLPPDVLPLVREFASNSFKYLFRRGDNVGDLLTWKVPKIAQRIDFAQMQAQADSFVTPGFSALESDVLLRAPLRGDEPDRLIDVYVLIENQAEPDELMSFRALRYVVLVYEQQIKQWQQAEGNIREFRFHPVLPVVFYSGTRTWDALTPFRALVRQGELFGKRLPEIEPLFVNVATTSENALKSKVGLLGWVLWLNRQSKRKRGFGEVLQQVVRRIDMVADAQKDRWEELLWYAHALVYHEREAEERDQCAEYIRAAVREAKKEELGDMRKTIADAMKEEGEAIGRVRQQRETLLRQLRLRFKKIPESVRVTIEGTENFETLSKWLDAFASARKLSDIPFDNET